MLHLMKLIGMMTKEYTMESSSMFPEFQYFLKLFLLQKLRNFLFPDGAELHRSRPGMSACPNARDHTW